MKVILIVYAVISIIIQLLVGELTGLGQGSLGLLTFLFLVEIDPRFRFRFIIPNIKERRIQDQTKETTHEQS
ncbi:hypothetical protein [Candidatus Xianfuyuplasma coldseepsis]|uniref:Uncharacterized protein n=1 Tax=Candidatus Xianfuyuplasma coldseepsis TaxID=2782163 RepID=A0A7L7KSC5_9MOLU|nr:hypothetical protein [Xianfuyuplasma coldseepsis]QMS84688.1 hypothetical protein G4Z02_02615 [Xianfuyuplasma coldseepsis]